MSLIGNRLNPELKLTGNDSGDMNKIQPDLVIHNRNPISENDSEAGGLVQLDF